MAEPKQPSKPTPQPERKPEAKTAPQPAPVVQNAPAPVIIKQSGSKGLAVGALVLALLGLGASGFLFVQGQNLLKNQELSFAQKLDKAALGESENALVLKDAIHRQTLIQAEMQRLGTGQTTNAEQIKLTQRAYQDLVKGRANWLVDEAESMLNLASQQLLLAGNVQGAIGVLEHIQSRLSRFDQPELLPIKQAVSRDLTALKNRPYVDISGTALRIDRLEAAATGLPLLVDGTLTPSEREAAKQAAGRSWWENAWDKSLEALKGLVELRRLDSSDAMLIAPDQIYFVRENLRLRLLDARIALMQHNGEAYQSDLNNAEAAVKQYFDPRSPATQSWLKELAELKALDVRMVSDESLKASLTAVAVYQDGGRPQADIAAVAAQAASAPAITAPAVVPASAASAASAGTRAAAASSVAVPSEKPKAAASAPARPAAAPKKPVQQAPRPAAQPPRAPQSQESQIDPQFRKPQVPQIQQIQPSPVQPQAPGVERVIIRGDEE
ncbi:uroporphyrinogen-III C-methyltransferase [Neisseria chenwenguii]|nr:uroporphyrinogen-III C-methyltransferase [Neisseria chenwenguii]